MRRNTLHPKPWRSPARPTASNPKPHTLTPQTRNPLDPDIDSLPMMRSTSQVFEPWRPSPASSTESRRAACSELAPGCPVACSEFPQGCLPHFLGFWCASGLASCRRVSRSSRCWVSWAGGFFCFHPVYHRRG